MAVDRAVIFCITAPAKQTFFKDRVQAPVLRQVHDVSRDLVLLQLGHGNIKVHLWIFIFYDLTIDVVNCGILSMQK